jgi:hypothetical protein
MNEVPLTDEEVLSEQHDLEIMRRRHLWPNGPFLQLKQRVAIGSHRVPRSAILYHCDANPELKEQYIFLPEVSLYSIPAEFWTYPNRYRTGGETLLFEVIMEGWIVG